MNHVVRMISCILFHQNPTAFIHIVRNRPALEFPLKYLIDKFYLLVILSQEGRQSVDNLTFIVVIDELIPCLKPLG